ncbi:endolytic transglycosylase MltG [Desulfoferrobacter suflitae]|uniref:endolytic transglycosylase MltG n=1 Tax=Desulfoferrobacter suflitae TaxID=2865782 RepID=UPI0021646012|nr:endolytic transglycosylase MltG [Desulfoferrobacter suflitae]MCK8602575.1 endolytic transglycosylase MltG [Desulfoferrobacter suflitae]
MSGLKKFGVAMGYLVPSVVWLLTLAGLVYAFQFWMFVHLPGRAGAVPRVQELTVEPGMGAAAIADLLERKDLVADAKKFYLLCRLTNSGQKLKAGEYAFFSLSSPAQILDQIVQGKVLLHRVTIPEGSTLADVAAIIERAGLGAADDISRLTRDRAFIDSLDLPGDSLEGYLFPETYYFSKTTSSKTMLRAMVRQFQINFSKKWQTRARELGWSVQEVVTMSSIVEKEAVVDAERPVIAGVFLNRLKLGMPLQSDPTAVYDLADFSGPITREHLQRQSPYNTYQRKGLPPGPICNPGAESMRAVLYPEDVPYLYFVSNNDGTHRFSRTLEEHYKAVSIYRQNKN